MNKAKYLMVMVSRAVIIYLFCYRYRKTAGQYIIFISLLCLTRNQIIVLCGGSKTECLNKRFAQVGIWNVGVVMNLCNNQLLLLLLFNPGLSTSKLLNSEITSKLLNY